MQETKSSTVIVEYKCSEDMMADVLTNSLGKVQHVHCIKDLGIYLSL